ncbi:dihydrolipoyllysine-residue acetyltransferase [Luteimonas yindakuii]|uniref:Acetyltransferase component of pyruvate dehydrogenase complex n=1 Tax=Luteimonas yindakuii TaxID=2565782 RepID=A0A4Z1R7J8_9GAMM|nr:dihydrolipoyllysine-residue acetyltransferase [Luteimonas yindakuii]TKS54926.1 dihydrolipoyllysine-residue acetyltransferase [Luteimonas yindakuii]
MADLKEARVPDIGGYDDVPVIEVLVSVGDRVEKDQGLLTLESDKATMEVPAPFAGTVREFRVKEGDKVSQDTVVAMIEPDAADDAPAAAASAAAPKVDAPKAASKPAASKPAASASGAAETPAPSASVQDAPVPDIGGQEDVPVIEVLVAVGDRVEKDQGLVTLESDKATMEVPAPFAGTVVELTVKVGDTVSAGSVVARIEGEAAAQQPTTGSKPPAQPQGQAQAHTDDPPVEPASPGTRPDNIARASMEHRPAGKSAAPVRFDADAVLPEKVPYASPAVRLFARELGVELSQVGGSARGGRITREDVQKFVKGALAGGASPSAGKAGSGGGGLDLLPWPKIDFSKFGEVEEQPLSRIRRISGANLARNWAMIPHVTQHDDADITELEALRVQLNRENEKAGIKLTMLAFLIKASASALKTFPEFNASLDASGETLTLKKYFNVGFAADTPNGLVVPVVRDVDRKGVIEIAQETSALAKKARDGKLGPADMQGGCFSISSLGGIGGTSFTPIVNAPEVAILGVSRAAMKPVWNGEKFKPRLVLPLSLSYDHRVIDGAAAARFTAYLAQLLGDMRRVLL